MDQTNANPNIVVSDNKEGNPLHKGKGTPDGGQFTSKEDAGGAGEKAAQVASSQPTVSKPSFFKLLQKQQEQSKSKPKASFAALLAQHKQSNTQQFVDKYNEFVSVFSETQQASMDLLSLEDKKSYLSIANKGFNLDKINRASPEEINALFAAESIVGIKLTLNNRIGTLSSEYNQLIKKQQEYAEIGEGGELNKLIAKQIGLTVPQLKKIGKGWITDPLHKNSWGNASWFSIEEAVETFFNETENGNLLIDEIEQYYKNRIEEAKNDPESDLKPWAITYRENDLNTFLQNKEKLIQFNTAKGLLNDPTLNEQAKAKFDKKIAKMNAQGQLLMDQFNEVKAERDKFEKSGMFDKAKEFRKGYLDNKAIYSKERKEQAIWIKGDQNESALEKSIKHFGPRAEEHFASMSSLEKAALIDYTGNYSKYNEPLRGISYHGQKEFGLNIGGDFASAVTNMTNAIDKCTWDEDIWVQRGIGSNVELFKLPGEETLRALISMTKEQVISLLGTSFTEKGFCSCGAAKNTGFSSNPLILNIFCPRGTKMAYVSKKSHFSSENEMILQHGYSFRITKVERKDYKWYLDCEVILGSDDSKPTGEELENIGNIHYYKH